MDDPVYVVATIKPWHIEVYHEVIKNYPGEWHLISEPQCEERVGLKKKDSENR